MTERCAGCAFSPGTEANGRPLTLLQAKLCVAAANPFYCHENIDASGVPFEGEELEPCAGYVAAVEQLERRGHYARQTATERGTLLDQIRITLLADEAHGGTAYEERSAFHLRRIFRRTDPGRLRRAVRTVFRNANSAPGGPSMEDLRGRRPATTEGVR